jgi:cell division protein FtsI (penicillin-binding protein 3)
MSIGYETHVPPISTITFYNGIANNGKMMRPRFVKAIMKDGEVIKEYPPVVVREHMAKESTIKTMQTILEHVVSQGLGKKAGSPLFKVAGKTGTAQISQGAGGYHAGTMRYLISFAGFFPADNPKYSCIVCIQKTGAASGGGMCGPVFRRIAEGIMAQNLKQEARDAKDSTAILIPSVKNGNLLAADYVLHYLGFGMDNGWQGKQPYGDPVWGIVRQEGKKLAATRKNELSKNTVPDVTGMGARDAVYLMESMGIKVRLEGRGKVTEQSIAAGKEIAKGMICTLKLS